MSLNTTTLSAAISASDTTITLAATTGIVAPNPPVTPGSAIIIENEMMVVTGFSGTSGDPVKVTRGLNGTKALAHGASAPVLIFSVGDYVLYNQGLIQHGFDSTISQFVGAPVTMAATMSPSCWGTGSMFHTTGTTAMVTLSVPSGVLQTEVTIIFDGSGSGLTWTAAGNIAVAGTATTAGSSVTFRYDAKTSKWSPSRLA